MSAALTRRGALRGALALPLAAGGILGASAACAAPALSANDTRLAAIAEELHEVERAVTAFYAAHRGEESCDDPAYSALLDRYEPLEEEMAATPADSLAGVLAKARALDIETVAHFGSDVAASVVEDVRRLHGAGRLAAPS